METDIESANGGAGEVKSQNLFLKQEDDVDEQSQWQLFAEASRDSVFGLFFLASKESSVPGWWAAFSTNFLALMFAWIMT
jgi:hypothetical protein